MAAALEWLAARFDALPRAVRAKAAVGRHRAVFMCQDCCATNVHIQLKGNVFSA